jgi:hypothetical protein
MTTISNVGPDLDIDLQAGADFLSTLTFTDVNGSPIDLTGSAFAAQIRKHALDTVVVESFTVTILSPPTGGIATLGMTAATSGAIVCGETQQAPQSKYVWDLKWTDSAGEVSTPLGGAVIMNRQVTR